MDENNLQLNKKTNKEENVVETNEARLAKIWAEKTFEFLDDWISGLLNNGKIEQEDVEQVANEFIDHLLDILGKSNPWIIHRRLRSSAKFES